MKFLVSGGLLVLAFLVIANEASAETVGLELLTKEQEEFQKNVCKACEPLYNASTPEYTACILKHGQTQRDIIGQLTVQLCQWRTFDTKNVKSLTFGETANSTDAAAAVEEVSTGKPSTSVTTPLDNSTTPTTPLDNSTTPTTILDNSTTPTTPTKEPTGSTNGTVTTPPIAVNGSQSTGNISDNHKPLENGNATSTGGVGKSAEAPVETPEDLQGSESTSSSLITIIIACIIVAVLVLAVVILVVYRKLTGKGTFTQYSGVPKTPISKDKESTERNSNEGKTSV